MGPPGFVAVMSRALTTVLTWVTCMAVVAIPPAESAAAAPCAGSEAATAVGFDVVESTAVTDCQPEGSNISYEPVCGDWGPHENVCPEPCWEPDGAGDEGMRYAVLVDGERTGEETCIIDHREMAGLGPDGVPTGEVLRAFRRLEWPASDLIVQPPDGVTLVNFDTNFLTDNTDSTRQRVQLLGQTMVVEATPASYIWQFGDGDTLETETPGARYPDLEVTHRYQRKETFQPRVDTVYRGRYRVNGGPWIELTGTHTVTGEAQDLEVIGARPVLVSPDGG